jgi:HEAT repeat protein
LRCRSWAISFFTGPENEQALLNRMNKEQRLALLPKFISASKSPELRNNACIALGYYQDQSAAVTPVLCQALLDKRAYVQLVAAQAIHSVAAKDEVKFGVVSVLTNILASPNDQYAFRAAQQLGTVGKQPAESVPALLEAAKGTNTLVANAAIRALQNFPTQAPLIIPTLKLLEEQSAKSVSRTAGETLKRLSR